MEQVTPPEGCTSREMSLKDRISQSGTITLPTLHLPFLLGLLAPFQSVGASPSLGMGAGRASAGAVWQEAEGPPRRSRGQQLILQHLGRTTLKVRSAGSAAQPLLLGQRRSACTHPLSIFCSTRVIGIWFMTGGHVFWTYTEPGCRPDFTQHNNRGYLSPIDMTMNRFRLTETFLTFTISIVLHWLDSQVKS